MYTRQRVKNNLILLLNKYGQRRLTENQNIPASTVSTWKAPNKTSIPNVLEAYKIAKEFKVPIDYLVTGEIARINDDNFSVAEPRVPYGEDKILNDIIKLLRNESDEVKIEARGAVRAIIRSYSKSKGGTGSGTQAG